MKTNELKEYCESKSVSYKGCLHLLDHLISTGWKQKEATLHIKKLIDDGIFQKIKNILNGGNDEL